MNKLIDAALGIHPQALAVGARRLEVLAANLANADTPGFKARDVDFRAALATATGERAGRLEATHPKHLTAPRASAAPELRYRIPNEPSLDGNTVEGPLEQAAFAEAAVRYQASLDFLAQRIEGLRKALRGE
ncbi:MAG TPA: flagellar basal body rod protein FlgB [Gammaproteobacteria bacterium]